MNVPEFETTLQRFLRQEPFLPFLIELDDGERWVVPEQKAVMYLDGPTGMYFRVDGSMYFLESHNVLRIVELVPAGSA